MPTQVVYEGDSNRERVAAGYWRSANTIYAILGIVELSLALRFLFLLLGANRESEFVGFIYWISGLLAAPFYGIFGPVSYDRSYFDPATIIAMVVYAAIAWIAVRIIGASKRRSADTV